MRREVYLLIQLLKEHLPLEQGLGLSELKSTKSPGNSVTISGRTMNKVA